MFAVRHPIKAQIDDQKRFIEMLLDHFPSLLKDWEVEQDIYFRELAKEIAEGDSEIEATEYAQLVRCLDDCAEEYTLFYNAMAILIYSYYESAICRLLNKSNASNNLNAVIKEICDRHNISLSENCSKIIEKLHDDDRIIRNHLCHNNNGTPKNIDKLKSLAEKIDGLTFENGIMCFFEDGYLKQMLQDEYIVLEELMEKLNYRTRLI